jgi:hypothetical protein
MGIDQIILPVRADETDVHNAVGEVDFCDQPIFVARYIEHHAAILQHTCRAELRFHIGW